MSNCSTSIVAKFLITLDILFQLFNFSGSACALHMPNLTSSSSNGSYSFSLLCVRGTTLQLASPVGACPAAVALD
jgi:hypothetical protein